MLEVVRIKGFMSHLDTEFNFTDGLNSITGFNDSGKSSILHAIRWFSMGEPKGDKFRTCVTEKGKTIEAKETTVELVIDGITMAKTRTASGQTYYTIEDEKYFKTEMPEEIRACLGIQNVYEFGSIELELNFVFQLDMPFLLSEAPSTGAFILGRLANTEVVDITAKELSTDAFNIKRENTILETAIAQTNTKLDAYKDLDKHIKCVQDCKDLLKIWNALYAKRTSLFIFNETYKGRTININSLQETLNGLPDIEKLHRTASVCMDKFVRITNLSSISGRYNECYTATYALKNSISTCTKIVLDEDKIYKVSKIYDMVDYLHKVMHANKENNLLVSRFTAQLKVLTNVGQAWESVKHAKDLFKAFNVYITLNKEYNKVYNVKHEMQNKLVTIHNLVNTEPAINEYKTKYDKCIHLQKLDAGYDYGTNDVTEYEYNVDMFNKIQNVRIDNLMYLIDKYKSLTSLSVEYVLCKKHIIECEATCVVAKTNLEEYSQKVQDIFNETGVCPLCNTVLNGCKHEGV
jgi:exonuclease SbcC